MEYRLDELFDLQMGKTPSRNNPEYWDSEDHKWISISDLSKCGKYIRDTKEYLSDKAVNESGISQIPPNTVIMSFKLSIGKTAITAEPIYSNEAIMSFRDKHLVELLPDYIFYMFSSKDWESGTNKAVMGKTLNKATLSAIKVRIHPISEQRKIVEVLDKTSSIIEGRRRELKKLDDLIKARFVEMFGDPILNDRNWQRITLLESLESGRTVTYGIVQTGDEYENGTPVFRPIDIAGGRVPKREELKKTDPSISAQYKRTLLKGNELLITVRGSVGETFQTTEEFEGCNVGRNIVPLVTDSNKVLQRFLQELFAQDAIKAWLKGITKGIALQGLNMGEFKEMPVIMPPISKQEIFVDFLKQIDKSKAAVQAALDEAQLLFDSLMQEYFG